MSDEEKLHIEMICAIHKNGNSMSGASFKKKFELSEYGFISILDELEGIVKWTHGASTGRSYISLTKKGIKLAEELDKG